MCKLVKMLRQGEVTLLQSGFNSNSAGNAFSAAAGPCRGCEGRVSPPVWGV